MAAYRSHHNNATNNTFKDGTALKTHQLICNLVDGYIDPMLKRIFLKLETKNRQHFGCCLTKIQNMN